MITEKPLPNVIDRLVVPEEHRKLLTREGIVPPIETDVRRFPRCYKVTTSLLRYKEGLPTLRREPECHVIKVLDLSRGGLGFLHSEQLFPGEEVTVALADDRAVHVEIRWCRRLDEHCYHIGAKFIGS